MFTLTPLIRYPIRALMKKIIVDEKNRKAFILDKEFILKDLNTIECNLSDTKDLACSDFYEDLDFTIFDVEDIKVPFLNWISVSRSDVGSEILLTAYITCTGHAWHNNIAMHSILRELKLLLLGSDAEKGFEADGEDETFWVSVYLPPDEKNLYSTIRIFLYDLISNLNRAEEKIVGFRWKDEYDTNEDFFTKDLLIPLFQCIGYNHVRFNHGAREFGKDILLSETTKLYDTRHISVQVKAGNVSGKAGVLIDTIISQVKDSFDVPVSGPGVSKQFRISEVYVVISGKYSENAKEKINAKIGKAFTASIYFLDREDIQWLTQKHWPLTKISEQVSISQLPYFA